MNYFEAVFLGLLQGIGEFLPISSSGHLLIMRLFMGLGDIPDLFDILLHIATLLVVIVYFRKRIWKLLIALPAIFRKDKSEEEQKNVRMIIAVLIASPFTAVIGYFVDKIPFNEMPLLVFGAFIITGGVLLLTHFFSRWERKGEVRIPSAIVTGIAQGIAVIPGISRSGSTIASSMLTGVNSEEATDFSFIMSIPAILGAFLLKLKDSENLLASVNPGVLITAFTVTVLFGFLALFFLVTLIKRGKLYFFSFYLIPMGLTFGLLTALKIISF